MAKKMNNSSWRLVVQVVSSKLGAITLSGLSFEDARDLVKTRVAQQLIGVDVVVTMGRLRAISIFMAGEVSVPGAYSVSASHGDTGFVSSGRRNRHWLLRQIEVRRAGKYAVFDAYDLLMRAMHQEIFVCCRGMWGMS